MTTHEVAEASSPLTDLESECEVVSAPAKPAASLVFFPRPPLGSLGRRWLAAGERSGGAAWPPSASSP